MPVNMKEAMDKARYVEFYGPCDRMVAVWHGSHTINFYHVRRADKLEPITCINVGDFETGETTLQEVKDGISAHIKEDSK